jgi:predicted alpha/beta superfamily hydrolase
MIGNDESPLPGTEVHFLRSEHVGDEFKILIGHCGSSESGPSPVLFMGDAWANFGTAVEITRLLCLGGDIESLLVVAVGYRVATIEQNFTLRSRDFTPTVDTTSGYSDPATMGGAGRFLAFLRDELKPWVRERYDADPDDSAFFGDSLGGLFATYVLLQEPSAFPRFGIGSPSLYWDQGIMFEQEQEYARTHDDLPAKAFFSVGAFENPAGDIRWRDQLPPEKRAKAEKEAESEPSCDMVADAERMVTALRGRDYPSLEVEYEALPGEYHHTSPPLNLSRSLRYLFDMPR